MKWIMTAVLPVLLLGALAVPTLAQVNNIADPLGSLYLSASPTEHQRFQYQPPLQTQFLFYLVMEIDFAEIGDASQNATNGARAWEAEVSLQPEVIVLANNIAPSTSLNIGKIVPPVFSYIVGTGTTRIYADSTPFVLVTYSALLLEFIVPPFDLGVIGPTTPATVPGSAAWVEELTINGCTIDGLPARCIRPFARVLNLHVPAGISDEQSWGTLKSDFGRE